MSEFLAAAFDKPQNQVLEAAGYVPHLDVTYQAINEIMQTVREDQNISDKEKIRLDAALIVLITSDWMDSNPDWSELVKVVLKQKLTLQEKAGRIANFVELSKQG
ncbi:MAG: hypothetical protein H0U76_19090 [Ktedonobacteraceae bacterium]|nr:hypothetical protein [Ktedonobacteraceae bacterium]